MINSFNGLPYTLKDFGSFGVATILSSFWLTMSNTQCIFFEIVDVKCHLDVPHF